MEAPPRGYRKQTRNKTSTPTTYLHSTSRTAAFPETQSPRRVPRADSVLNKTRPQRASLRGWQGCSQTGSLQNSLTQGWAGSLGSSVETELGLSHQSLVLADLCSTRVVISLAGVSRKLLLPEKGRQRKEVDFSGLRKISALLVDLLNLPSLPFRFWASL